MRSLAAAIVAVALIAACAVSDAGLLGDNRDGWNWSAAFGMLVFVVVVLDDRSDR